MCEFGGVKIVGERLNPTGKKRFGQALRENDLDYILQQGIQQADAGADILDVNVGLPGIDETQTMINVVKALQSVVSLPLQIDSSDPKAIEAGLRCFGGRAIINSVNGEKEKLDTILPIAKKYGAEYLGSEYGEKWFENRITFFYPGHIMNNPQMFGTMDTISTYDNIEKIYWAMKRTVEENFSGVRFISHSSHWYDWGCMNYSRFIIDEPPDDEQECIRLHDRIWNAGVRAAITNGGVINDHHGVGLKLGRLMKEAYGPAMQVLTGIKKQLDPNGIMNPYKMGL